MKKILLSVSLLSILMYVKGQNLIVNPGFEINAPCPGTLGDLTATGWYNPNTGNADYFHQCNGGIVGVPSNFIGYQNAHGGVGYVGGDIFTQPPFVTEYREYVEGSLNTPLIAGNCYHFEMWVNHANNSNYATDDIGVYFTPTLITGVPNYNALPYTPQVSNTSGVITDTANWVLVSGDFTAAGGEQYFVIGNFKDDANTSFQFIGSIGNEFTYYLYDDVSLELISCTGINEQASVSPEFDVYPNPAKDGLFVIDYLLTEKTEIIITNASGRKVLSQFINNQATQLNISALRSGVYFIELKGGKNIFRKKFIKE